MDFERIFAGNPKASEAAGLLSAVTRLFGASPDTASPENEAVAKEKSRSAVYFVALRDY